MSASAPASTAQEVGSIRAFVGLGLGDEARRGLQRTIEALAAGRGLRGVRWVEPSNLHLTLRFLGDVGADDGPRILEGLERGLVGVAPFRFTLSQPFGFPTARRPRVIAMGLRDDRRVAALAAIVERSIVALGLPPEPRPFRAHVTLGRFRHPPRGPIGRVGEGASGPLVVRVDEVRLYRSELAREGARYSVLGRVPLAGSADAGTTEAGARGGDGASVDGAGADEVGAEGER